MSAPLPLAFTCGDPAGVGPEIIARWLAEHPAEAAGVAVVGPSRWLATLPPGGLRVPVGMEEFAAVPGRPTGEGALVAWAAMERAAVGCREGEFAGVVTGPVSKAELARIGYPYPGQTEFFAARWGGEPVMAFCGGKLRVVLATWHIPWHEVPRRLGPHLLRRAAAAADTLCRAEGISASASTGKKLALALARRGGRGHEVPPFNCGYAGVSFAGRTPGAEPAPRGLRPCGFASG